MDRLMELIERERIHLRYRDLNRVEEDILGLHWWHHEEGYILLDKSLVDAYPLHRCVLAVMLGHHFTYPKWHSIEPNVHLRGRLPVSEEEQNAFRWACEFLIPNDSFLLAVERGLKLQDISAYFAVTQSFMIQKGYFFTNHIACGL